MDDASLDPRPQSWQCPRPSGRAFTLVSASAATRVIRDGRACTLSAPPFDGAPANIGFPASRRSMLDQLLLSRFEELRILCAMADTDGKQASFRQKRNVMTSPHALGNCRAIVRGRPDSE